MIAPGLASRRHRLSIAIMTIARTLLSLLLALTVAPPLPATATQPAATQTGVARTGLAQRVETILAQTPTGTRFGLVVTDETGRELVAINPDGRFMPASNTKIFTTAAAYATLTGIDQPDAAGGASVALQANAAPDPPDVILYGRGDARMSSAPDCRVNCLAALADAVAARTRRVRTVIGDASLFPNEPWSPGMSWNNISSRSGTGIAALGVDDNEWVLTVTPTRPGERPTFQPMRFFVVDNRARTVAEGPTSLSFERLPGSREVLLTGTIAANARPATLRLGVDDPEALAASRLEDLLRARGVQVDGSTSRSRFAPTAPRSPDAPGDLARLTPPPLAEDIVRINKDSQNLHAELLLRRIGLARGNGSIASGLAEVESMMARAGVPRTGWDLSDGSGMSTYNRVSPRAMTGLLRWIARQPWGATWRDTLPVAGIDGTLSNRFRGTALERRLFAKTGTINATNALSGYLTTRTGRTLTFAFFANDIPGGASVTAIMDAALLAVAEAS